jgi:hypothetical protein
MEPTETISLDHLDEVNLCLRRASAVSELLSACDRNPDTSPETVSFAAWITARTDSYFPPQSTINMQNIASYFKSLLFIILRQETILNW